MKELLFYDIEVFKYNSLVVFKNLYNETVGMYWNNDPEGFEPINNLIKDKILIGYNNYYYDNKILTLMLRGVSQETIKRNNDILISGGDIGIKDDFESYDCFQQIDLSRPSLKKIEGNLGKMIKESDIDFNIDRPLTEEEKRQTEFYCCYDVENTIEVYKLREHSYFESKNKLIDMLENKNAARWNTTTIAANLLLKKPLPRWSSLRISKEVWENSDIKIPEEVWSMWNELNDYKCNEPSVKSRTVNMYDCDIQFGFGGLHGANNKQKKFKNVKLLDVASMYPSIIINLEILGDANLIYKKMKLDRIEVKHKDKLLSDALKLVLNSVYGLLKNQYSLLYNPKAAITVCVYGQIALFKLVQMLAEKGCTIININTDGVAFVDNGADYETIWREWQEEFNLDLELDEFDLWLQKDVNNYIATQGDKIKVKGGEVKRYQQDYPFGNNNARILDVALVDYLVKGKSVIDTLINNLDKPKLYQYILRAGRTYKGVYDEDGIKYNNINRVFASLPKYADKKLFKMREDGGLVNFADVPDHMKLWDKDVDDIKDFSDWIDINHYYQIVMKRLKSWE